MDIDLFNMDNLNGVWVVYTKDGELVGVFTTKEKCQSAVDDQVEKYKSKDGIQVAFTTLNFVPGFGKNY